MRDLPEHHPLLLSSPTSLALSREQPKRESRELAVTVESSGPETTLQESRGRNRLTYLITFSFDNCLYTSGVRLLYMENMTLLAQQLTWCDSYFIRVKEQVSIDRLF